MSYALHWMRYKTCLSSSENRVCGDQSPHIPARKVIIRPAPRNDSAPIPGNLSISSRVKRGCSFPRKGPSSPVKSYQSKRADSKIASEGENDTEPATFSVTTQNNSLLSGTATKSAQQVTGTPYIPILQVDGGLRVTQLTFDGYGTFGGQFAPESIMGFLSEVTFCFKATVSDPGFWSEYARFRPAPTSLHVASNLTSLAKGATIWLKREDQNDYGSHKARNITGQLLLAKRMGRQEVVTDCASAKHGSFTAAMCARLGLRCVIVMGTDDAKAQCNDVAEIKALRAKVLITCTPSGMGSLRAAITEALRYAVCHHESAYYLMGSPVGPSPLPTITRTFQSILGEEVMHEMHAQGIHPDALVVAIGGGSGAVGLFRPFLQDVSVRLVGVEAAQAAPLATGELGVLHGARTLMLQSPEGQITDSHSISPDMNLSTVGPEVAYWKDSERVEVSTATDEDAIHGFEVLRDQEGILSGLDSSHAVRKTLDLANSLGPGKNVVLMVTGRDKIAMRGTIL